MLKFWKVEAIGNDFPLVRLEDVPDADLPELAKSMSDRRFGVGGDGLLAFGLVDAKPTLRMFNPDGTEDFCGNGLRAAGRWAFDQGLIPAEATVLHRGSEVAVKVTPERVETTIPGASYEPKLIPMLGPTIFDGEVWAGMESGMPLVVRGSALTTGSTHVVLPTTQLPADENFRDVSKLIERDDKFYQRTSVIWSRKVDERTLEIRIWERGVGETQGCGTGSAAAAVDHARRWGLSGAIEVRNPGGTVTIRLDRWDAPITIIGEASVVYEGEWLLTRVEPGDEDVRDEPARDSAPDHGNPEEGIEPGPPAA